MYFYQKTDCFVSAIKSSEQHLVHDPFDTLPEANESIFLKQCKAIEN